MVPLVLGQEPTTIAIQTIFLKTTTPCTSGEWQVQAHELRVFEKQEYQKPRSYVISYDDSEEVRSGCYSRSR